MLNSTPSDGQDPAVTGGNPQDSEVGEEMFDVARQLIRDNYKIVELFYTIEFDKDAHFERLFYNNPPEAVGGFYTLLSGVIPYESADEIFSLVEDTFVKETADSIINSAVYEDLDGKIGVSEAYTPEDIEIPQGSVPIELKFVAEDEFEIIVTVTEAADENGEEVTRTGWIIKEDDGNWRLKDVIR